MLMATILYSIMLFAPFLYYSYLDSIAMFSNDK